MYRGGSFDFYFHPEGYVSKENGSYKYVYQYKDHLGNIRVSYDNSGSVSSPNASIVEEHNYYPFGLRHRGYNDVINGTDNPYGYNRKELEESLGLNWLEYGARNYDASIGRFMNIDRFAESFMPISTYQYGANNPISYIDYNGDYITIGISDDEGNQVYSVLYENGKAYHYSKDKDGNIVKGDEYDGNSSFVDQAVSDLNKIADTNLGNKVVGNLQDSKKGFNIGNSGNAMSNSFNPNNNEILYSSEGSGLHDGVFFNKSHIKLGHELGHAYDVLRGFDFTKNVLGGLPGSEINAVKFENYLRAQDGETKMRL
nr:RHS repeat-associated core domain-containing protein [Zunongwangia pacifica]